MKAIEIGDTILYNSYHNHYKAKGVVKSIHNNGKRIGVLKASTTTGNISMFTLRKNGKYMLQGFSMDDMGNDKIIDNIGDCTNI